MDTYIRRIFDTIRDDRDGIGSESVFDGYFFRISTDGNQSVELREEESDPEPLIEGECVGDIEAMNDGGNRFSSENPEYPAKGSQHPVSEEDDVIVFPFSKSLKEGFREKERETFFATVVCDSGYFHEIAEPFRNRVVLIFDAADRRRICPGYKKDFHINYQ
jgi:hypothetical protein